MNLSSIPGASAGQLVVFLPAFMHNGGTAPPTQKSSKIRMFCALSQNYQHLFENNICIL